MKQFVYILFFYLLTLGACHAQLQLKAIASTDVTGIDLHFKFRNYQLSSVDAGKSLLDQLQTSSFRLQLTLPGGRPKIFVLSEVDLFADDYVQTVAVANGRAKTGKPTVKTFVGYELDGPARLTATIDDDFFEASVHEGEQSWYLEQARGFVPCEPGILVIYSAKDVLENQTFQCGVEAVEDRAKQLKGSDTLARTMAGSCVQIRLAIASDALMLTRYGSVSAVRNRVLSTMNEVAAIYRQEFVNNIEFQIVSMYISETYNNDPLFPNTTSGQGVLAAFRRWAYTNNGFNVPHNIGQLWTTRALQGAVAWGEQSSAGSGICNRPNVYHVLTDESGGNVKKRVSHEIGHNLSAGHDVAGSYVGHIMSSGYSPGLEWSDASRTAINNHLLTAATACLANCTQPVVPAFEMKSAGVCVGSTLQFSDRSVNGTSDRLWELEGGTPTTSVAANPLIRYGMPGLYDVSLTSSGNVVMRKDQVFVSNMPKLRLTNCQLPTGKSGGGGIRMIGLNGTYIFPSMQDSIPKYADRSCIDIIGLQSSTSYDFAAMIGARATETTDRIREYLKIYIDYNNDGLFNEINELVVKSNAAQITDLLLNEGNSRPWLNFMTPSQVIEDTFLRMRVISDNVNPVSSCHNPATGQVKDFAVVFRKQQPLPVNLVYFKAFRQQNLTRLEWETGREVNSDRFEVECSSDLRSWVNVGTIRSDGTSNQSFKYMLEDTGLHSGTIYYRLRMIDKDGSFAYSRIVSITYTRTGLMLFPNPALDRIIIKGVDGMSISFSDIEEISIASLAGVVVLKKRAPFNYDGIDVRNLENGTYFLRITFTEGSQSNHKVIVNK
jgi:PKD repeat protein